MYGKKGNVNIMKKIFIISTGLFMILPVFIFSIFILYVIGRVINNIVSSDKNDSEVVVEEKETIENFGDLVGDIKTYYDNQYEGKIEKIEDNKIYFMVDKKGKELGGITTIYKDVEDYRIVFALDSYTLEYDPFDKGYTVFIDKDSNLPVFHQTYYDGDYLTWDFKNFYSADELEFLVGKYLTVYESMAEYCSTGITNKYLSFSSN